MNIQLTLAWRYLWGRKLRLILTTLAIVFGVTVLFGLNTLLPIISQSYRQTMMAAAGKVDLTVTHVTGGGFDQGVVETLRAVPGIARATGLYHRNVTLPPELAPAPAAPSKFGTSNSVTVTGLDPAEDQMVRVYSVSSGRFLQVGDGDVMVIPESFALKVHLGVGDSLTLPSASGSTRFEIVGILAGQTMPGSEEVLVPLSSAQRLFGQPGQINTMEALFAPGADRAGVEAAVQERLGDSFQAGPSEVGGELMAAMDMGKGAMDIVGLLALAMGAFVIFNTFRTVVAERRRDMGMLRAVGASRRTVVGLVLTESLIQGVIGTAIGLALGYAMAAGMLVLVMPVISSYIRFDIVTPFVTIPNLVEASVLGIGITVAGGLFPALSASRVTPLEALRPPIGSSHERAARWRGVAGAVLLGLAMLGLLFGSFTVISVATLLFLIGLILLAPVMVRPLARLFGRVLELLFAREGRLAEGNLSRQPGRAAITAAAVMIGLAIVVTLAGFLTTVRHAFVDYLDHSLGTDYIVMPTSLVLGAGNMGAGPELAQQVRQIPGVSEVTTLRLATTVENGTSLQLIGVDPVTFPAIAGLDFSSGDPEGAFAALSSERAIIVNGIFSAQSGVRVGDVLPLQTLNGKQDYRVVGIGMDFLNAKISTGYISQANIATDFHQETDVLLMANQGQSANSAQVHAAMQEVVGHYPAFALVDAAAFRQSTVGMFEQAMYLLYFLMVALAFPGLLAMINTLAINVIERTREIGVLRAVGSTQKQVRRMILAESILLAAVGTAFGLLAGLWLSYVMVGAMQVSGFVMSYYFPANGVIGAIAVGLLFGVLAASIPARQAARLQIVQALRYE